MRCTLEQVLSIPESNIYVDIRAVDWGATGIEFCGCIVHEQLPAVIHTMIDHKDTTLLYVSVPTNHVKHYFAHKSVMRKEWAYIIEKKITDVANSNIQQMKLEL
jgi:hypothetical protein